MAEYFERTDTGRQRRANEDAAFARPPLFVVADGMGGARAGEVASQIAVQAFSEGLPDDGGSAEERLTARAQAANREINDLAQSDDQRAGMGTTITAAYVTGDEVSIAHVGDSRAYRMRDGQLERLTHDHSLVAELVQRGKLTEEEAEEHPQRSVITRALGPEPSVDVDTCTFSAKEDDRFLLCSDGLTSMLPDTRMAEILREEDSLERAGRRLIEEANERGGRDNITVVLLRLEEVRRGARPAPGTDRPTTVHRPSDEERAAVAAAAAPPRREEPPRRRRTPRPPSPITPAGTRRRRLSGLGTALTVLAVAAVVAMGAWIASRAVYFVGTDERGFVTVFQGLPWDGPAGVELYDPQYVSGVAASNVPVARRRRLLDHQLRSEEDAADLVRRLETGQLER